MLDVNDNPLASPPISVCNRGSIAILKYLKDLLEGSQKQREKKIPYCLLLFPLFFFSLFFPFVFVYFFSLLLTAELLAAETSAEKSVAEGVGITKPPANVETVFTIRAKTSSGDNRTEGGDPFVVQITTPNNAVVTPNVVDNRDGTYTVYHTYVLSGKYLLLPPLSLFFFPSS
jgi:hypothetical protein